MEYTISTKQELLDAIVAADCDFIQFASNVELDDPVDVDKDLTIDLGLYTFSITANECIRVRSGHVSFVHGTIISDADDPLVVSGSGAVLELGESLHVNVSRCAVYAKQRGLLKVTGAEISSTGEFSTVYVEGYTAAKDNTRIEMLGGKITSAVSTPLSVKKRGIAVIRGGEIVTHAYPAASSDNINAIYIGGLGSLVELYDGSVFADHTVAVMVDDNSAFHMYGGTIQSNSEVHPVVSVYHSGSSFIMEGGFIISQKGYGVLCSGLDKDQVNTFQMTGGSISVPSAHEAVYQVIDQAPAISILGGSFHGQVSETYLPADLKFSEPDENGNYSVIEKSDDDDEGEGGDDPQPPTPEPTPDPDPDPDPDDPTPPTPPTPDVDPDDPVDPEFLTTSYIFKKQVPVYLTYSRRYYVADVIGAVTVHPGYFEDGATKEQFRKIEYVLPGLGGRTIGYVSAMYVV